ncbi:hypothetical protein [Nostocoides sp.]|jgi:hypothetical protein|uniref:hypothetical protein n=1 Tax=Nostocoides sp. TaxID=1917966 RepID=UPI002B60A213|nr:hypothetical protein [Tetrasphaera sp.]
MWERVEENTRHLSHDMPCLNCGHAEHIYLPCDAACGCSRSPIPGVYEVREGDLILA